jgi:hypothetical protein
MIQSGFLMVFAFMAQAPYSIAMSPLSNGSRVSPKKESFHDLMGHWPVSWAGVAADIPVGQQLVEALRPFILHLQKQNLSPKTVRHHLDNLWAIGGEIMRQVNNDPSFRKTCPHTLLLKAVECGEAPLVRHASEDQQKSCDATARRLLRFLSIQK